MEERSILAAGKRGLNRGLGSTYRLLSIVIPVSLAVNLLDWIGLLHLIGRWLGPVLGIVGLPGEAAVSLLSGALVGIYAAIAALAPLHLTIGQLNVLAVMALIAHSLPLEGAVQQKSGVSGWRMVALRLGSSFVVGFILARIVPGVAGAGSGGAEAAAAASVGWGRHLVDWLTSTGHLALKMLVIITVMFVLTEILREYGWLERISKALRPVMAVLGLPASASFAWLTAAAVGLLYGSALIIEEAEQGHIDQDGLVRLNASIGVSHSLLEDTALFASVGAGLFWLLIPRLIAAALLARVASYLSRSRAAAKVAA